jgi:hypothetical protein
MDNRQASKKQEKRIVSDFNKNGEEARVQKASGALYYKKSDAVTENFRVEAKTKVKPSKSITLKKADFDKIGIEAIETGKVPVLVFSFGHSKDYYALEEHDFFMLLQQAKAGRVE